MEKTVNNPAQNRNYVFFMIAFVTGYQNPLGSVIEKKTVGNAFMSQLPTFANFIAYAFMGIPAGIILQRKGYRITAMLAVALGFTGVLVSFLSGVALGDNVPVYLVGAFISGFSMCLLNTVVNPMLNSLGSNDKKGNQLVQFGGTCNSLGATLAPAVVGYLMGNTATNIDYFCHCIHRPFLLQIAGISDIGYETRKSGYGRSIQVLQLHVRCYCHLHLYGYRDWRSQLLVALYD